jgi:hypothetical protein
VRARNGFHATTECGRASNERLGVRRASRSGILVSSSTRAASVRIESRCECAWCFGRSWAGWRSPHTPTNVRQPCEFHRNDRRNGGRTGGRGKRGFRRSVCLGGATERPHPEHSAIRVSPVRRFEPRTAEMPVKTDEKHRSGSSRRQP